MNGSELTEAPLTSAGLSHLIADHNELKTFIKTAFTLTSGGRMSDQYLARLMPNILAILESRTYVRMQCTRCWQLTIGVSLMRYVLGGSQTSR